MYIIRKNNYNFSEEQLKNVLSVLTDLDYKSKRGEINLRVGMELVISSL